MEFRKLGHSGLEIAPLVFGGNIFGWTVDEARSFQLLDAFVADGFNFIDTADVYSRWFPGNQGGESETILGRWLQKTGNRSRVLLATKVGMEMGPHDKGLSRTYILRAVERSLNRLQTDTIDLYQAHIDDKEVPLEETLGTFAELIRQGKVRAIGASNYAADRLSQALEISRRHGWPTYSCLQPHYNLIERPAFEGELEAVCVKEGLGVIPYFSLASGFLTGKYRTEADLKQSQRGSRVQKYLNHRGLGILNALDQVARRYQSTPARVALAWLLARPSVTAPIVSATSLEQWRDLVESIRLSLDNDALEVLHQASVMA